MNFNSQAARGPNVANSLVPQGGLMCEECPLGLSAFLSTRPPKGLINISDHLVIPNKSDGDLREIMIKSRGHFVHTGSGIEPTLNPSTLRKKGTETVP